MVLEETGELDTNLLEAKLLASGRMDLLENSVRTAHVGSGIVQAPL